MTQGRKYPAAYLSWFLWLVGAIAQLAFLAAVMPSAWIAEITEAIGLEPFPETPLAYYLARHLSLLYGVVGIVLILMSRQLDRHRPLIRPIACAVMAFGLLQGWIDVQSGMPIAWSVGESISTVIGGAIMWWLDRNCGSVDTSVDAVGN